MNAIKIVGLVVIFIILEKSIVKFVSLSFNKKFTGRVKLNFIKDIVIRESIIYYLNWYEDKAAESKARFLLYSILTLILSASIPIVTIFPVNNILNISLINDEKGLIIIISSLLTIINASLALINPKEKWNRYRLGAEQVKSIIMKWYGSENQENTEKKLLLLIEEAVSNENKMWSEIQNKSETLNEILKRIAEEN